MLAFTFNIENKNVTRIASCRHVNIVSRKYLKFVRLNDSVAKIVRKQNAHEYQQERLMIDINWSSAFLGSIVFLTLNLMSDISQDICFLAKLSVKIDGTAQDNVFNLSARL